jgi:hypothetical protein
MRVTASGSRPGSPLLDTNISASLRYVYTVTNALPQEISERCLPFNQFMARIFGLILSLGVLQFTDCEKP